MPYTISHTTPPQHLQNISTTFPQHLHNTSLTPPQHPPKRRIFSRGVHIAPQAQVQVLHHEHCTSMHHAVSPHHD